MTTYYCRVDGTASSVAAATGPITVPASCMSRNVFNAGSFSPGDEIIFSSRGGDFTYSIVVPSSGSSDSSRIILSADEGYAPNFSAGFDQNGKSYLTLNGLTAGTLSSPVPGTGFQFKGNAVGVIANNLISFASSQGVAVGASLSDTLSVVFNNLYSELVNGGTEGEAWTSHGAITCTINGGTLTASGGDGCIESAGAPTVTFNDVYCTATNGADAWKQSATGVWTMNRCVFEEDPDKSSYGPDFSSSTYCYLYNCVFKNLTDAAYYLLFYNGALEHHVINCTFIGDGVNTTIPILNQSPNGRYINNVFKNCGGTKCFYGTSGEIDYNAFYGSGTPRGTNYVTTDPLIDSDGKITSASSPLIDAGIGPDADSDIPAWDIDNQERSGSTTDLGADLWVLSSINLILSDGKINSKIFDSNVIRG